MFTTLAKLGGAEIPKDHPIDGVDQTDFFRGKQAASAREGFLVYIYSDLYAVNGRNWKYHLIWLDDMAKTPALDDNVHARRLGSEACATATPKRGILDRTCAV
jgi:hypothetical protein